MRPSDPKPRFDTRSPVQSGRSPAPYFIAAIIAAIVIWTVQQRAVGDSTPGRTQQRAVEGSVPDRAQLPAKVDLRTLFSADDYPADAQRNGEEGTVQARLAVNAQGRVTGCAIMRSSGHASLDHVTCDILQRRALFAPAHDANGKAVRDSVVTPLVVWRLQD
jgi:TonB family protein